MQSAAFWIEKLQLKAHPEGGFYSETYRSQERIGKGALPDRYTKEHVFGTAIYFLLNSDDISAFHRIKSDEMWFFHTGAPVMVYFLTTDGVVEHMIGDNVLDGHSFQLLVPANTWFAARVIAPNSYTLVSCTVSPGFDFEDFELAKRHDLLQLYPGHKSLITELTHA